MTKADIGIIGLGVMGRMLALNMERRGYRVAGYDLDAAKVTAFERESPGKALVGCRELPDFIAALARPRRIMMMVPSGKPVDAVIDSVRAHLAPGDLLIDGGNSFFQATERRAESLAAQEILYLGAGVSGGEQGALWGPSIMPGGPRAGWELVQPIFEAIAAQAAGEPCVAYLGPGGAGHYVKMVHNGIEYGVMQLIAEVYDLLHRMLNLSAPEMQAIFADWNAGELASYLIEITADIFGEIDPETSQPLIDVILDTAKQKGTGKWTSQNAMDVGAPTPTITAAVEARVLSSYKEARVAASRRLPGPTLALEGDSDRDAIISALRDALYAAMMSTYAQGFALLRAASAAYDYRLDYGEIAKIWRGGCIIRADFLDDIRAAFARTPDLSHLLMDEALGAVVVERQGALRYVVQLAAIHGIPAPAFSATLAYFDGYRTARLPANLTQAQRDYFGAHTYQRLDRSGAFHTNWQD